MNIQFIIIVSTALVLSACGHPHQESSILNDSVSICMHEKINESSDGYIDWSAAASPLLEDFEAVIAPRGWVIVDASSNPGGPIVEKMNIPFCDSKIPPNAKPYASVGKSKLDKTDVEKETYQAWKATQTGTPYYARETLYVVDGVVQHVNIMAIESYSPTAN